MRVRYRTAVNVQLGVLVVLLIVANAAAAQAQGPLRPLDATIINSPANPVPVNVVSPIQVSVSSTGEPFTLPPVQLTLTSQGALVAPDPSGTRYAITSLTVVNPTSVPVSVVVRATASALAFGDVCRFVANLEASVDGPELVVSPNSTGHITFPQPFITAPVAGTHVCLLAHGAGSTGVKWSAVGYKILP